IRRFEGFGLVRPRDPVHHAWAIRFRMKLNRFDPRRDVQAENRAAFRHAVPTLAGQELAPELGELALVEIDSLPVSVLEGEKAVTERREQRMRLAFRRRVDGHNAEFSLGTHHDRSEREVSTDELERIAHGEERLRIRAWFVGFDDAVEKAREVD